MANLNYCTGLKKEKRVYTFPKMEFTSVLSSEIPIQETILFSVTL